MTGISNTKSAIGFLTSLIAIGLEIDANNDGKVSFTEGISAAMQIAPKLTGGFEFFKHVPEEIGDLDQEELNELVAYFEEVFDIPNDRIEEACKETLAPYITEHIQLETCAE